MANGKQFLKMTVVMIALVGVLGFQLEASGMLEQAAAEEGRADVIMIDTIAKLGELEQAAVVFQHDQHTKALKDQGMSCESCHEKDADGNMLLAFKRTPADDAALSAGELKDLYHDNCLSCHVKSAEKGFETGPKVGECRGCHQAKPVQAEREPAGMDSILHYAHWDSVVIPADAGKKTNCGACHKEAGKEDSWRHDPANAGKAMKDVYHAQCVTCHQDLTEKKAERTGPTKCAGCHGEKEVAERKAAEAKKLADMGTLPRLERGQPDAVLMFASDEKPAPNAKPTGMAPVAFNHKLHEGAAKDCATCHVDGVNAPMDKSFAAMHDAQSDSSCIGCHAKEQAKPECAGCHAARSTVEKADDSSCATCHNAPVAEGETDARLLAAAPKETKEALAASIIAARPDAHALVSLDAIPETVTIGSIADQYKPSEMPHRKIVLKMMDGMKESSLAATFHADPAAMCAGCHHNSPATASPSKCSSCHAEKEGDKPSLKAAYHGQCMDCHTKMKLEKPAATNCVACHEKKAN